MFSHISPTQLERPMFSHISPHPAWETHVLSYIPPPSLRDPCSLIYPPTQLERPMVSSLPCPPKSGSLACKIVLTSSLNSEHRYTGLQGRWTFEQSKLPTLKCIADKPESKFVLLELKFLKKGSKKAHSTVFEESLWSFRWAALHELTKVDKIFFFFSVPEVSAIFSSKQHAS